MVTYRWNMAIKNGYGSAPMEYKIAVEHFNGKASSKTTLEHIPEGAPFKNASEFIPVSFGFSRLPTEGTWDAMMEYKFTPYLAERGKGEFGYFIVTSGNTIFVPIEDLLYDGKASMTPQDELFSRTDREADRIRSWRDVTEQDNALECVEKPSGLMFLIEGTEVEPNYNSVNPVMPKVNVLVKDFYGENVDINMVGKLFSKIANFEQDLRGVLFQNYITEGEGVNEDTLAFFEFLLEKGLGPPRDFDSIGVQDKPDATASMLPRGEKATLFASVDIYEIELNKALSRGLEGDESVKYAKYSTILHELYHVFDRRGLSRIAEEIDAGEFLAEYFGNRSELLEGKIAVIYKNLAKGSKQYADMYRDNGTLLSRINGLVKQYTLEAEEKGLKGDSAEKYIADRLDEETSKLEESGSESKSIKSKNTKYCKGSASEENSRDEESVDPETSKEGPKSEEDGPDDGGDGGGDNSE